MQEQRRNALTPALAGGGTIWDELAGAGADDGAMATVAHGPYAEALPVANMTVAAVRSRFRDRLDIDPAATALIDGRPAGEDDAVQAGQLLTFVRRAGEKGWRAPWSRR